MREMAVVCSGDSGDIVQHQSFLDFAIYEHGAMEPLTTTLDNDSGKETVSH